MSVAALKNILRGLLGNHSLGATQRSLGRGLRRMVTMFHTVRDLVGECDRRAENEASGEDVTYTDEYVALCSTCCDFTSSLTLTGMIASSGLTKS